MVLVRIRTHGEGPAAPVVALALRQEGELDGAVSHAFAVAVDGGFDTVAFVRAPLEEAASTFLRVVFEAGRRGAFGPSWEVGDVRAWEPGAGHPPAP